MKRLLSIILLLVVVLGYSQQQNQAKQLSTVYPNIDIIKLFKVYNYNIAIRVDPPLEYLFIEAFVTDPTKYTNITFSTMVFLLMTNNCELFEKILPMDKITSVFIVTGSFIRRVSKAEIDKSLKITDDKERTKYLMEGSCLNDASKK